MKLRKYQENIVNNIRELFNSGHRMVLTTLATGGGKGVIIGHIAKLMNEQKKKNWLISHRYEIHRQLVGHCIKQDVYPGQILSGQRMTSNYTQVGMIATIYNRLKYMKDISPELIQHDEAHRGVARTNSEILNFWENTKVIGWTATPSRTDGTGLNQAGYTAMVQSAQSIDLINAGFLSPLVLLSSETTHLFRQQKFKKKNKDYDPDDQSKFASGKIIVNDTLAMYKKYFNGQPCIIFCCSVEDSKLIASSMRAEGWKCEAVYDDLDKESRLKYIDGLSTGSMNAVCCFNLLTEGIDIPILAGCIIRRLTTSIIVYLQQVGRTLRKSPGKKYAIVIDQAGNCFSLQHPLIRREWSLDGSCKSKDDDESLKIKQCPACSAWIMSNEKICPYCGEDLTKIKPERPDKIKIINAPLVEIKPPEILTGQFAIDEAEISEYDESDMDIEIIKRLQHIRENQDFSTRDRLAMICKYFGKSNKWMNETWDKYFKNNP